MAGARFPDDPDLDELRQNARGVFDWALAGIPGAVALYTSNHPDGEAAVISQEGAELVVARHYGFDDWAAMEDFVGAVRHYRRNPGDVNPGDDAPPADRFLALACLRYSGDDGPERWAEAAAIIASHPDITATNIHAAAADADVASVRALLGADASLASLKGGPYGWEPLLYLAYA
ncbi:MAG TPA: hypothetical protein VGS21_10160, partial [Acidimicrobiales bacterium]|nr:hypothetical protein [Acidimicrobiales bacterium]